MIRGFKKAMKKIGFVGDLILGDQPVIFGCGVDSYWSVKKYQGLFDGAKNILKNFDITVANFEAIIKKRTKDTNINNWSMCCDENVCRVIKDSGIDVVSVANNHTFDYGTDAYEYTLSCLEKSGISIIGKKDKPWVILKDDDLSIGLVGVSYLRVKAKENVPYFFSPSDDEWERVLSNIKECDKKIVYVHWGNEFIPYGTEKQKEIADKLSSFGFDIIVGHHPHIIENEEMIKNTACFYSLGNFVSDYWQKRLRKTYVLEYNVSENKFFKHYGVIDKKGAPVIGDKIEEVIFDKTLSGSYSVFLSRTRVRFEYLFKMILSFHKIRAKKAYLSWIFGRFKYILKYGKNEIKNPDIVYEKYME